MNPKISLMSYEERRAYFTKALQTLARTVAPLIGGTYSAPHADSSHWVANINLPFGGIIAMHLNERKQRVEIRGRAPLDGKGQVQSLVGYNEKAPDISVSLDRDSASIAKDIARRLIPAYQVLWDKAVARAKSSDDHAAATRRNLAKLAGILGETITDNKHGGRTSFSLYQSDSFYGEVEVGGDSASIKVRSLTMAQAERLAKLLVEFRKEGK